MHYLFFNCPLKKFQKPNFKESKNKLEELFSIFIVISPHFFSQKYIFLCFHCIRKNYLLETSNETFLNVTHFTLNENNNPKKIFLSTTFNSSEMQVF